jgi:hypothetical protein
MAGLIGQAIAVSIATEVTKPFRKKKKTKKSKSIKKKK